ncbi:phage tail tube protein [Gilvimarinus agarilyticus]|uniref:phage tail tube protein n=1 Tax=Gilvimarinus agarilyticus TaxID=679259 RepID=UPI0005A095CC|nr:phage tail tube protein [Gilvimarinus agarilyticus]
MGERIFEQDTLCLAAVEANYATDAAPTAAANAMRVATDLTLLDGDQEALEYDAGRGGSKGSIQRNKRISGSLTGYLAGVSAAGEPPAIGPLMQIAGLVPTVTADTDVTYAPASTGHDSATLHVFRGKIKHGILGARCNLEMSLGPDALPKMTFNNLMGLYVPPTQVAAFQDADFTAFTTPSVTDPVSITVMTLFGQAVNMSSMMFKLGNNVVYRAVVNDESVQIVERRPQIEITFEEPQLSDYNWWEKLSDYGALAYQLGEDTVDEGNIFELNIPNLQLNSITPTIIDGISHLQCVLDVVPTARDNDFTMVFR